MKKKYTTILFLLLFSISFLCLRNYIRLFLLKKTPVTKSYVSKYNEFEDGNFNIKLFKVNRLYNSRSITYLDKLFSDKLLVISVPLKNLKLKGLVLKPEGNDKLPDRALFYFNTLFFTSDFSPSTGIIINGEQIGNKAPKKTRIGITSDGNISVFQSNQNSFYNDILQVPFSFRTNSKVKTNFLTLNFRQFITIYQNQLIYITGYNNSLISWSDVSALMFKLQLNSLIALDGGASLNYFFRGKNNNYEFSSVPFRNLWFNMNSPYYLTADLK